MLAYLTERILYFSILKHLDNPVLPYTGIRTSKPREGLGDQLVRRGPVQSKTGVRSESRRRSSALPPARKAA